MKFVNLFCFIAPLGLNIEAISSTMLNLTVIPPANSEASYFTISFNPYDYYTSCDLRGSGPFYSCIFRDLKPATRYNFMFFSGALADGLDIQSDYKYKSGSTPPESKSIIFASTAPKAVDTDNIFRPYRRELTKQNRLWSGNFFGAVFNINNLSICSLAPTPMTYTFSH